MIGIDTSDAVMVSAKTGIGIDDLLEAMVKRLPPPKGDRDAPLKALLVDSWYDPYLGVVTLVRVQDGVLKKGQKIRMMAAAAAYDLDKVGIFTPKADRRGRAWPGRDRLHHAGIKTIADCKVGDTITDDRKPATEMLAGFKPSVPVVFCGLFPADAAEFENLRESLSKLRLNDSSFHFEPETSAALGFGFRCGFLGLLHLEIVQERLEREFNLDLVTTAPSVVYKVTMTDGSELELHNPADYPDPIKIETMQEPWIKATIITPDEHLGSVLTLCQERRGQQIELTYAGTRAMAIYRLPLNEVVFDFYDRLKSMTRGYASFDYEIDGYEEGDLVKLAILVNAEPVDALSMIVHKNAAEARGRAALRAAEGPDPAAAVQDRHPGRDRRPGDRARDHQRDAQGRAGQVLWRRHQPQEEAPGEAEEGQEAHAADRRSRDSAVGLHRRSQDGQPLGITTGRVRASVQAASAAAAGTARTAHEAGRTQAAATAVAGRLADPQAEETQDQEHRHGGQAQRRQHDPGPAMRRDMLGQIGLGGGQRRIIDVSPHVAQRQEAKNALRPPGQPVLHGCRHRHRQQQPSQGPKQDHRSPNTGRTLAKPRLVGKTGKMPLPAPQGTL